MTSYGPPRAFPGILYAGDGMRLAGDGPDAFTDVQGDVLPFKAVIHGSPPRPGPSSEMQAGDRIRVLPDSLGTSPEVPAQLMLELVHVIRVAGKSGWRHATVPKAHGCATCWCCCCRRRRAKREQSVLLPQAMVDEMRRLRDAGRTWLQVGDALRVCPEAARREGHDHGGGMTDWITHMAVSSLIHAVIYGFMFRLMGHLTLQQDTVLVVVVLGVAYLWARSRDRRGW